MGTTQRVWVVVVLWAAALCGQTFDFYAYGPYTPNAPRPEAILGYAIGERHSYHHQMEEYMKALAAALPQRVKMIQYGASYEGRRTWLVIISSEENMKRVDEIRASVARLKDPRKTRETEARQIAKSTPAIVWLNYANDGNESSAFEASMQMAYQVAAGESAEMKRARERTVTLINPSHNPESHERFVTWYNAARGGPAGNADPQAVEHRGDWLMDSNDNHYHIDLNRDAYAVTQKESQEIVRTIQEWNPQVFIDHHGNPPVMFFPPVALPTNANFPESTSRWEAVYGKAIAAEFRRYGWSFFNREVFDLFFPGYYDSYPTLNGASGLTFETDGGGNQGLKLERADKTQSSMRGGVAKHFTGSYAVLLATAENHEQRLVDYYQFRKSAIEEGTRGPVRQYVLVPGRSPDLSTTLVSTLLQHQVEVFRSTAAFTAARTHNYFDDKVASKQFPAGSYVIPLDQPQKRLVQALLEKDAKLNDEFVKDVFAKDERNQKLGRRAAKEPYGFYDVTAWSMPLSYGVDAYWTEDRTTSGLERVTSASAEKGSVTSNRAAYGYVIPSSNAALRVVGALFQEDYKLLVARGELRIGERTFPAGSFLARVERNPESLHQRIAALAAQHGVTVHGVDSPWTDVGMSLGSRRMVDLKKPVVAMAAYEPTNGRSYGHTWFLIEQRMGYPFTAIKTSALRNADLGKYDVIIFPDGSDAAYQELLGTAGVARLRVWIEQGGVFIGIRGGATFAMRRGVEWTSSRLVGREPEPAPAPATPPSTPSKPEEPVERTPGAMLRASLNDAHFLSLGYDAGEQVVLHNSDLIFTPSRDGTAVISYAKEDLKLSGFIWKNTETRLAGTAAVLAEKLGRGHVILFAEDPNFRLVWNRWTRLFMNAVFLAPSLP